MSVACDTAIGDRAERIKPLGSEFVATLVARLGPEFVASVVAQLVWPPGEPVWLTPTSASVTYRQIWIVRTAAGAEVQVVLTSRRRGGGGRYHWYGVNLVTGREVRVTKLLQGSLR